jgi:transposase
MPAAVKLREDFSAEQLRALARRSKDVNQSRRLLSLAAIRDGKDRGEAARIGGMDRQTLRDWVHRFNAAGPEGLFDNWTDGPKSSLSAEQLVEFAKIVEAGPDRERAGVVRWRRVDLKRVIAEKFGVDFHERYVGTLLKKLGFSHISARPRHPAQDGEIVASFKNFRTTLKAHLADLQPRTPVEFWTLLSTRCERRFNFDFWIAGAKALDSRGTIGARRPPGASGGGGSSPEDQPLEVIDEVGHPDLHSGAGDADGADVQAHPVLLFGEDVFDVRPDSFRRWRGGRRPASGGTSASCDERG